MNLPSNVGNIAWLERSENWESQISNDPWLAYNDSDLDWFWKNQVSNVDFSFDQPASPQRLLTVPLIHTYLQERDSEGHYAAPRYLHEAGSKAFVASPGNVTAPSCGFPICNALTQDKRIELLMDLRDIMEIDIRDRTFSLNSLKQGVHLWSREISTEYSFLHRELLFLNDNREMRQALLKVMEEPPGSQLVWSVITFGWALMKSSNNHELQLASKIQRAIRSSILSVS